MRSYVEWIIKFRVPVMIGIAIITAIFAGAASTVKIDINRKNQLPANHPLVKIEDKVVEDFGGARVVALALVATQGTIYTPSLLAKIQRITESVEAIPGVVHSNVLSIAAQRAKSIEGNAGGLTVQPLMEQVPTTPEGIAELKRRINSQTFYTPLLVSVDGRATALGIFHYWQLAELDHDTAHKIGEEVGLPSRADGWVAQAKAMTAEAE